MSGHPLRHDINRLLGLPSYSYIRGDENGALQYIDAA